MSAVIISVGVNAMHYTGLASAHYIVNDGSFYTPHATLDSFTAVYGSLLASTFFLWAIVLMSIADLRIWFYSQSNRLREINDMMHLLEASTVQCDASRLAIKTYKNIRQKEIYESERLKILASKYFPKSFLTKVKVQPSVDIATDGHITPTGSDTHTPFFRIHAAINSIVRMPFSAKSLKDRTKILIDPKGLMFIRRNTMGTPNINPKQFNGFQSIMPSISNI